MADYGQMYPDLKKAPQAAVQKVYWDRRLPAGFRFVLERLARHLIKEQPRCFAEGASYFLDNMLEKRAQELADLPKYSYFDRLNDKSRGIETSRKPLVVRCCKCGKIVNAAALAAAHASGSSGPPRNLVICSGECCKVMALPVDKGTYGRKTRRDNEQDKGPYDLSCRSLAMLYDY